MTAATVTSTPRKCPDDVNFGARGNRRRQVAHFLFTQEDIHVRANLPLLVDDAEGQTGEAPVESADRFPNSGCLDLDDFVAARVGMQQ